MYKNLSAYLACLLISLVGEKMNNAENSPIISSAPPVSAGTTGFLDPERTIAHIDIQQGMTVADFGCGAGHFTVPSARFVGGTGKVYAIDVQKSSIEAIKSRANLEHLLQVEAVWADLEQTNGSRLKDSSVDVVIISNILYQIEAKQNLFIEASRILRPGGRLAIIEWDATPFPAGPAAGLRIPSRTARSLAEAAGFIMEKEFDAGSNHYGLLFKKQ